MPEFLVLRCFSCGTFQGQQRKKKPQWVCKICGAKQSVQKIYASSSSGKEIRDLVQQFNTRRREIEEMDHAEALNEAQARVEILEELRRQPPPPVAPTKPKQTWDEWIENDKTDELDDADTLTLPGGVLAEQRQPKKRKFQQNYNGNGDTEDSGNYSSSSGGGGKRVKVSENSSRKVWVVGSGTSRTRSAPRHMVTQNDSKLQLNGDDAVYGDDVWEEFESTLHKQASMASSATQTLPSNLDDVGSSRSQLQATHSTPSIATTTTRRSQWADYVDSSEDSEDDDNGNITFQLP